jgi:hypothetical protein
VAGRPDQENPRTEIEGEMTDQLKEVQPTVQFETWWKAKVSSIHSEREKAIARAAWQAALAAQSAPVDLPESDLISIANRLTANPDWRSSDLYHALLRAFRLGESNGKKNAPVDWEKVVREKFPNADSRDGAIWKSEGSFTILGYSWQHAAHHPDVIGQDKWEGEDGK